MQYISIVSEIKFRSLYKSLLVGTNLSNSVSRLLLGSHFIPLANHSSMDPLNHCLYPSQYNLYAMAPIGVSCLAVFIDFLAPVAPSRGTPPQSASTGSPPVVDLIPSIGKPLSFLVRPCT